MPMNFGGGRGGMNYGNMMGRASSFMDNFRKLRGQNTGRVSSGFGGGGGGLSSEMGRNPANFPWNRANMPDPSQLYGARNQMNPVMGGGLNPGMGSMMGGIGGYNQGMGQGMMGRINPSGNMMSSFMPTQDSNQPIGIGQVGGSSMQMGMPNGGMYGGQGGGQMSPFLMNFRDRMRF